MSELLYLAPLLVLCGGLLLLSLGAGGRFQGPGVPASPPDWHLVLVAGLGIGATAVLMFVACLK